MLRRPLQPQHQGAGRLLGRGVRRRRGDARPGRAHPGAPRLDAGVGGRGDRALRATLGPGRAGHRQRPVRRVAPTSTTSRWWHRASSATRLVGWVANRAHHADVGGAAPGSMPADATEIHQEGLRLPPVRLTARGARPVAGQLAHARGARRRPRCPGGGQRGRGRGAWPSWPTPRSPRCSPTVSGGCRAALAALPAAAWRAGTCSTRPARARPAATGGHPLTVRTTVTVARRRGIAFDFTGTDPQRAGNINAVEAVTVVRGGLRAALAWWTTRCPPTPGPRRRCAWSPRRARSWPPGSRPRSVPATSRSASASPTCARRARPGGAGPGARGVPGHDEQLSSGSGPVAGHWCRRRTVAGCTTRPWPEGRAGARHGPRPGDAPHAGMAGVHTGMTNTRNTPIEALERSYPMRVRRSACGRPGARAPPRVGTGSSGSWSCWRTRRCRSSPSAGPAPRGGWPVGRRGVGENWLLPRARRRRPSACPTR